MVSSCRWEDEFPKLDSGPGTVIMVIGGPDTGKTTFVNFLVSKFVETGRKVAYIDADIGQSTLGPPATIGLAVYETPEQLNQPQPSINLQFVGSINPVGFLVPILLGVRCLLDRALALGAQAIVMDTTGLVRGAAAQELKQRKIDITQPNHVVALQKSAELEPILAPYRFSQRILFHRLEAPLEIKQKSVEFRRNYREGKFRQYFANASTLEIPLRDVGLCGTWIQKGRRLNGDETRYLAKILAVDVLYGEYEFDCIYAVTNGTHSTRELYRVRNHFGSSNLKLVTAESLDNKLLSLNADDKLLALGLLQRIDFQDMKMRVLTPLKNLERIQRLNLGALRLKPTGKELA
ncbi:MAG: hypothetical protein HYR55_05355 [Acidobacteria bacterium]|nr:hypothetical protein [Acidobacteriota bacterium]MBI3657830.1 hypothetical protein [Acidobacteriota bacterium]